MKNLKNNSKEIKIVMKDWMKKQEKEKKLRNSQNRQNKN